MSDYRINYADPEHFQFWSGAQDRMRNATDEQREAVYARLDGLCDLDETDINDYVWFKCDDIFYPEEE